MQTYLLTLAHNVWSKRWGYVWFNIYFNDKRETWIRPAMSNPRSSQSCFAAQFRFSL